MEHIGSCYVYSVLFFGDLTDAKNFVLARKTPWSTHPLTQRPQGLLINGTLCFLSACFLFVKDQRDRLNGT